MAALQRLPAYAAVVVLAAVALSIPTASADRGAGVKKVTRTWFLRWPAVAHRSRYWVLQLPEPHGSVKRGFIYLNGSKISTTFPGFDFIVACAAREPAYASGTLHRAVGRIYALVVLTTGGCSPGPSVAGKLARVKVVVRYVPYTG